MKSHIVWREFTPKVTTRNIVILSALMTAVLFALQGDVGFNLQDEGFLWYGTIRTALGEVPVRDFQAYDPGRYYWGAMWFKLLRSDSILTLRFSQAVFQFAGLTLALLLLRRVLQSWLALIAAAIILLRWMFPPWKIYEPVILIAAIYFAVLIIEKPSKIRHLIAGVFIGLAAFFGRNHGLYCSVAFLLLILFVWWKIDRREILERLAALGVGIIIGYLPMVFMLAFVPGFFGSFVEAILFNLRNGTNLPLPVPWPWLQSYRQLSFKEAINQFTISMLFLGFPGFYLFAFARLLLRTKVRPHPLFIASAFIGAAYLHYTFDRPQVYYLAWTIPPIILGLIAIPPSFCERQRKKLAIVVWSIIVIFSLGATEMSQENYFLVQVKGLAKAKLIRRYRGDFGLAMSDYGLVKTDIRGENLWITKDIAEIINGAKAINARLIPRTDGILVAPYWTALYPILGKESPLWEIYFLLPQPSTSQERMVGELERKNINWAIVCYNYEDGRPELEFRNTHNLLWQYLVGNFETVETDETRRLGHSCELFRRTGRLPPPGPMASNTNTQTLHSSWLS
jgi:hypothetical protein